MRRRLLGNRMTEPNLLFGQVELLQQVDFPVTNTDQYSGVSISQDKNILYVASQGFRIFNININDPDDINTWTVRSMRSATADTRGIGVDNSGNKVYISGGTGSIRQLNLNTAHDLTTDTLGTLWNSNLGGTFGGCDLSPDNMKMFASFYSTPDSPTKILELQLQNPGELLNATIIRTFNFPTLQRGAAFSPNGDYFFTALNTNGYIHEVSPAFTLQNIQSQQITGTFNSVGQPALDHTKGRLYSAIWMRALRSHRIIF